MEGIADVDSFCDLFDFFLNMNFFDVENFKSKLIYSKKSDLKIINYFPLLMHIFSSLRLELFSK